MKLVVLGASGGCGRQLAAQAIERGHEVLALTRDSSDALSAVETKRGDLTDAGCLAEASAGRDAVISALGFRLAGIAPWHKPKDPAFLGISARAVINACEQSGIQRVMAISAGGVAESDALMPAAFRMFIAMSALRHVYPRLAEMEHVYLTSGVADVCVARPSGLTDGERTGKVHVVTRRMRGRATISRADVAAWMLDQLELSPQGARAPVITVTGI